MLLKLVAPAAVVVISEYVPDGPVLRSILKPVSLELLSDQARFIWLDETALVVRLEGAVGMLGMAFNESKRNPPVSTTIFSSCWPAEIEMLGFETVW